MAHLQHTLSLDHLEEALTVLFCLIDDAYTTLNPQGAYRYKTLKHLSDSEVIALALFQQLRGVESERSFLRDAERFFSHLFPGVVGLLSFLVQPAREEAQALSGTSAAGDPPRVGGRARDPARRLDHCWKSSIRARLSGRRAGEALRREPRG